MTLRSTDIDVTGGLSLQSGARERIDALLDEALQETFPASDSSAIGSGLAAIKQEDRESRIIHRTPVATPLRIAGKPAPKKSPDWGVNP